MLTGEDLGEYLLVGELAVGGMAEIFLAVQKGLEGVHKAVVVKRVLPGLTDSPSFRQMFADEARIAARLDHPNIVRTYDFRAADDQYFTVMEYLAGEDIAGLTRRLRTSQQVLPLAGVARIISDICKGLHFAHELTDTAGNPMGLVHRDLTGSNVVVTYAGEVKIIDFGVAKTTTNMTKTEAGTIKGKLAYMAPEQIANRPIDRRADVFSTGVVMWQLITLQPLFARNSQAATMYAVMNDPIPPPSEYRPGVPARLDEICLRALARSPSDRYATMEDLQRDLDAFAATQPPLERRWLVTLLESQFGQTRAEAKRAIAQTRELKRNIAIVMRGRAEAVGRPSGRLDITPVVAAMRAIDGEPLHAIGSNADHAPVPQLRSRAGVITIGALTTLTVGIVAAVFLMGSTHPAPKPVRPAVLGKLDIDSEPNGANVFIDGEPTGLRTPVHLVGVVARTHTIRLELPDFDPLEVTLDAPPDQTLRRTFKLRPVDGAIGQLVVRGLADGSSLFVDDVEYLAGEVVALPVGSYRLRVVADRQTLVDQKVDLGRGQQIWELRGNQLVRP
ncbi:MAG: protein kinase [Kofleriaceae bacterium]|nr:protein kinase [Kofleriaceae bacterium]